MKAPVGLLSDRTVLRSKMEGPRPDKFAFVEAVARKKYGLKQAYANGKAASTVAPFFGIHRVG